ncbi:hypothetical protein ACEN8I_21315 [Polaromonas sp. CT11-55]|uniref:hypothetical protein n=1 Tax=Polaromonas sp. CT11-55 TaxID=3243045 RepID=UPI0039A414D3
MTTVTVDDDDSKTIDLGNSNSMSITAVGGKATVHIDYEKPPGSGKYVSAIKGSSSLHNPFEVAVGTPQIVNKADLESEKVRVSVSDANIKVTY